MLSSEAKTTWLTSAGDIVVGQHSPHLALADWQVGVRVPLAVVWVAVAAVEIDLNLHLTMALHSWTRNQTQQVGLVQFFLPCSSEVKQYKTQQAPTTSLLLCRRADSPTQCGHVRSLMGISREEDTWFLNKQRGLGVNWPGKVRDWGCVVEPDDWCLSWFRDWE